MRETTRARGKGLQQTEACHVAGSMRDVNQGEGKESVEHVKMVHSSASMSEVTGDLF